MKKKILEFAREYLETKGKIPLIMGEEIYKFFGEQVKIVSCNTGSISATVQKWDGEHYRVDICELELQ